MKWIIIPVIHDENCGADKVHQSLLHNQAAVSECLLCSAMSTENDAEADACKAGDTANMHKYGLDHGDHDDDAGACRTQDTIDVTK